MIRLALAIVVGLIAATPAVSETAAKEIFGQFKGPSSGKAQAIGSYAKGCGAALQQLPETGPTWQAVRLSRNRNWGTPELIDFLERLSAKAARVRGWNGVYIGDMSQPRGGPMLTGHASHQIGLDADVWLLAPKSLKLSRGQREDISPVSLRRSNGAYVNAKWTREHMEIVKAAAEDPAVARIFLFPGAKVQMCKDAKGDRAWLRKVRPWWGHHYHFHVRLACPRGDRTCVDQAPPPPGDGCAEAEKWVQDILNPPKPRKRDPNAPKPVPRGPIVLSQLPNECRSVASER